MDHGLKHIGVTAYPDGHSFISPEVLTESLHQKQELLASAGVPGHASTQMCFDPGAIREWLREERNAGLTLPVHLGIPGSVDRAKLLSIGTRLGVGASLRFFAKEQVDRGASVRSRWLRPQQTVNPLSRRARILEDRRPPYLHL
ncbi:MAG: hypothetical protein Ct9H300mP26_0670 [Acidimicrobiales bacterium]|nr:MAG: hypothetical protein Ct9H300mP26_0670 [Acidimicrobiales bacterium]